jgi:ferredoxin
MTTITASANICYEGAAQGSGLSSWPQEKVERKVVPVPERYRNAIGKYKIYRSAACNSCGLCVRVCSYGVHVKPDGYALTLRPNDYRCVGPNCSDTGKNCLNQCPQKALTLRLNPNIESLGDPRWSSDLILSTWHEAETGHTPPAHLEYRHGASGGGFDQIRFKFEIPGINGDTKPFMAGRSELDPSRIHRYESGSQSARRRQAASTY